MHCKAKMPRGRLSKVDLLSRIYRLKNHIYHREWYSHWNDKERKSADEMLNKVLDILNEYSY